MWFLSTGWSKIVPRSLESRQKPEEMCDFCLPGSPKPRFAVSKVEQNFQKSEKCSTRLPSPKQCGLRLRAIFKKHRFARNRGQVQWLSRWCAALHLSKSLPFTDKSMKMDALSVNSHHKGQKFTDKSPENVGLSVKCGFLTDKSAKIGSLSVNFSEILARCPKKKKSVPWLKCNKKVRQN